MSHKMLALHITTVYPYPALDCPPASRFSAGNRIHHFPWLGARFWPYMVNCDILPAQAGWASFFWCSMTRCLCRWQELSPNPCFSSPDKQTYFMYHTHLQSNEQHKFNHWLVLWSKFNIVNLKLFRRYLLKIDIAAKKQNKTFFMWRYSGTMACY